MKHRRQIRRRQIGADAARRLAIADHPCVERQQPIPSMRRLRRLHIEETEPQIRRQQIPVRGTPPRGQPQQLRRARRELLAGEASQRQTPQIARQLLMDPRRQDVILGREVVVKRPRATSAACATRSIVTAS